MGQVRAQRLRYLRTLVVGLAVAAAAHLAILFWNPDFEVRPLVADAPVPSGPALAVRFGTPRLLGSSGETGTGSSVSLRHVPASFALRRWWPADYLSTGEGGGGAEIVTLDPAGRPLEARVLDGSGDLRKDEAFESMALLVRYEVPEGGGSSLEVVQPILVEVWTPQGF